MYKNMLDTSPTARRIWALVASFDISGERTTRAIVHRVGREWALYVDRAYEGTHTLRFDSLRHAQEWANRNRE